ncbi:Shedu anti-phage system protein SduA domain-containing protein [Micromonospora gifhornensis]|uniref:Shedu anti-phage system protein SduA domain-containing protein n=1 Tax=Micromonospora gifhornensis TaxID=84594 RepID=UPI003456475D
MIEKIIELGVSEHVRGLLEDALRHMGERSPYRGGKELVSLLRYAHTAACNEQDHPTSERVEDALAYAMNTMLRPDIEIKYQLFPESRLTLLSQFSNIISGIRQILLASLREFIVENPTASPADIQEFLGQRFQPSSIVEDEDQPGHYRLLRGGRESTAWLREVLLNRLSISHNPAFDATAESIATPSASLAELVELSQLKLRKESLHHLRCVVQNPHSTEADLQYALQRNIWIFGGSYLPNLGRRRLVPGNEFDLSLVRPDGSLHVVELKRANVDIVTHQRGSVIPNSQVHRAVGQVMNYLVALDEDRSRILDEHGIDVRRASGTVVIGYPGFQPGIQEQKINEALRTYGSHLTRVEVITYKQLLDGATRALSFG